MRQPKAFLRFCRFRNEYAKYDFSEDCSEKWTPSERTNVSHILFLWIS